MDWNVDQAVLFPATARDYVPEDHPVHYIRQFIYASHNHWKLTKAMA